MVEKFTSQIQDRKLRASDFGNIMRKSSCNRVKLELEKAESFIQFNCADFFFTSYTTLRVVLSVLPHMHAVHCTLTHVDAAWHFFFRLYNMSTCKIMFFLSFCIHSER